MNKNSKIITYINVGLRFLSALIMLQTLYFKFTGADESIYIFSSIGMEPWGRYLVGSTELIAGILFVTRWYGIGAFIGLGAMSGAIFFHLAQLGIEVQGDGGYFFGLALFVFISCAFVILTNFQDVKNQLLLKFKNDNRS